MAHIGKIASKLRAVLSAHAANHAKIKTLPADQQSAALAADRARFHRPKRRSGFKRLTKNISREASRPVQSVRREFGRVSKSVSRETGRAGKEVSRSAVKVKKEAKRVPKNIRKIADSVIGGLKFGRFVLIAIGVLILFSIGKAFVR